MKNILCYLILMANGPVALPQLIVSNESGSVTRDGGLVVYGGGDLLKRVPYSRIQGTAFLQDDWTPAILYDNDDRKIGKYSIKINAATQELYYLEPNTGNELVAEPGQVKLVVCYEDKSYATITTIFQCGITHIISDKKKKDPFLQILNQGKVRLLKLWSKELIAVDSLVGTTKRYFFKQKIYYALSLDDKVKWLKSLDRENFLFLIPGASTYAAWAEAQKLDLKKEEDVIRFLNYYNSGANQK